MTEQSPMPDAEVLGDKMASTPDPMPKASDFAPLQNSLESMGHKTNVTIVAADDDAHAPAVVLRPLMELSLHRQTSTPLTLAILGEPGCGKTTMLDCLFQLTQDLSQAAHKLPDTSPFLTNGLFLKVDAGSFANGDDAELAEAIFQAMSVGPYAALAGEAAQLSGDPHLVAHQAQEMVDTHHQQIRQCQAQIDTTNQKLGNVRDAVLNAQSGSSFHSFLRVNGRKISALLRGFGFTHADSTVVFTDLVRELYGDGRARPFWQIFLHATWAFKGQMFLLFSALVSVIIAWQLGTLGTQQSWALNALEAMNIDTVPISAWINGQSSWFALANTCFMGLAIFCLGLNLLRAWRFTMPLQQGVQLLSREIGERRAALNAQSARDHQRLQQLEQNLAVQEEIARLSRQRAEAKGDVPAAGAAYMPISLLGQEQRRRAINFIPTLIELTQTRGKAAAPARILLFIDNIDTLAREKAETLLHAIHRLLNAPLFLNVLALNAQRYSQTLIEQVVQIPFQAAPPPLSRQQVTRLLRQWLESDAGGEGKKAPTRALEAKSSLFDQPLQSAEAQLLIGVGPLAAKSPRALKRFANLYQLARVDSSAKPGALALLLALDIGGDGESVSQLQKALSEHSPDGPVVLSEPHSVLANAIAAANQFEGAPLSGRDILNATQVLKRYSLGF